MAIEIENETILYSKDSKNKIRSWRIYSFGDELCMESGLLKGEKVESKELIDDGLAGRTIDEQILSRVNSRINKQLDKGYVRSLEDAKNNIRTNQLGFKRPAKCSSYDKRLGKIPFDRTWVQQKLDGHHMSVVKHQGANIAFSSNGKIIDTIPHIVDGIELLEGQLIEGEVYCHGVPLQTISSWIKREQKDSEKLHYYVYDLASEENYGDRLRALESMELGEHASVLRTIFMIGKFDVEAVLKIEIEAGYEGLVLRLDNFGHKDGKRSNGMIKVKPRYFKNFIIDDEFLVVNILESKDGWARLVCETETGGQFKVVCHGTHEYKTHVYKNRMDYIGKHIRAEYAGLTKSKLPFHPVALCWRDKFEE